MIAAVADVTFAVLFGAGLGVRGAMAIGVGVALRRLRSPPPARARPGSTVPAAGP